MDFGAWVLVGLVGLLVLYGVCWALFPKAMEEADREYKRAQAEKVQKKSQADREWRAGGK